MTDDVTVKVEGLDRFVRTLRKAGDDLTELKDAHKRVGEIVATEAASRAPRRSGRLAGTIRSARQAKRAQVVAGRANVPYAAPIHWGWPARNIQPQPYLSDAAQATEPRWTAVYLEDIQKIVDQVEGA